MPITTFIWPEVFTNANYEYPDTPPSEGLAIADGLTGWAICMAGEERPELFGKGMIKIGNKLGILATLENLNPLADEFLTSE